MNKKLKIAIIGSRGYPYVYSGYETLVKELSERFVKKGHTVRVYCHSSLFKKKPRQVNGVELVYTPSIETKFLSQISNSFFSFIHVCFSNVDVVFVVNSANGPFGILTKVFRKKTCINVDGLEWLRPKWKGIGSIYFAFSSYLSTLFFNSVITDSIEMNKIYKKKFKTSSTIIAYGPTMVNTDLTQILEKYNLKKNEYYLIVGRLIPDNNSLMIIKGFIKSKSTKKLVIVGDVPYKDNYANAVKLYQSNQIIITGYIKSQNDLTQLYRDCYGYIHGHEFGGTNPTLINALYLNKEILALNTTFNREMLSNKKAIFFQKKVETISFSIKKFEREITFNKKENKNYFFPKKYDWKTITDSYLNLFKKTIKSKIS